MGGGNPFTPCKKKKKNFCGFVFYLHEKEFTAIYCYGKAFGEKRPENKAGKGQDVFRMSSKKGDIFFLAQTIEK